MRTAVLMAVCGGLALLSGCATMTANECLGGNWSRIGYQDGTDGYPVSRLGDHERACAAHGVGVDARAYLEAREQGLEEYCTPSRGYYVGSNGRNYAGVCPAWNEAGFLAGYADGRVVHEAQRDVSQARSDIQTLENRIRRLRKDIDAARGREREAAGTVGRGREESEEIRGMRANLRRAEVDLQQARRRHEYAQRELDRVTHRYRPVYGW